MNQASGSIDARLLWAWLLVALWIGLILLLSGGDFSASQTSRFIGPLLTWLFPEMPEANRLLLHGAIRKGAHVTEYAVLAALGFRALRLSLSKARGAPSKSRRSALAPAALALLLVAAVASVDEAGQARRDTRTGSLLDVGWDLLGGTLGCAAAIGLARLEPFESQIETRRP